MISVKDISEFRNCTLNMVNGWIDEENIKADYKDKTGKRFFNKNKANKIMLSSPQYKNIHKYTKCIDMYMQSFNRIEIAESCNMCTITVGKIINKYKETGEIIIESKLNFMML